MVWVIQKLLIISQAYSQAFLHTSIEAVPHAADLKSEQMG